MTKEEYEGFGFGLAELKVEGKAIEYDTCRDGAKFVQKKGEETFYFEYPFTKEQYGHMAQLFESSEHLYLRQLGNEFRYREIHGMDPI